MNCWKCVALKLYIWNKKIRTTKIVSKIKSNSKKSGLNFMADKTGELDKSYNGEGDEKGNKSIIRI